MDGTTPSRAVHFHAVLGELLLGESPDAEGISQRFRDNIPRHFCAVYPSLGEKVTASQEVK